MKYTIPFVNYPKQYELLKPEIDEVWNRIMSTGQFILRDDVEQFEKQMADYLGVKHCIGLNSGTDALYYSLLALGVGQDDKVITVSHTFVATIGAIVNCGATPVLIDIGRDFNMDVEQIEKAITPRTKVIIPVHLNGRLCEMEKVLEIADKYDLLVVEDACQALGARLNRKKAGTFGNTGCFSFYPAKILGCPGDGGMVATNDTNTASIIRWLRDNGRCGMELEGYGYNSRLDNLHAAILSLKLKYLDSWIQRRRMLAVEYFRLLEDVKEITLPPPPKFVGYYQDCTMGHFDVFQNFVIWANDRDKLRLYLTSKGIETMVSWEKPCHKQETLNLKRVDFPMTEHASKTVLSLPMYPELDYMQVYTVCEEIKNFYAESR